MKKNKTDKALTETETKKGNKVKRFFKRFFEILSKKWLVNSSTTLLLVVIIFAIYFGVTSLLKNVNLPDFDLTKDKIYSLSDETKDKVGSLNKEVKITLINFGSNETTKVMIDKYKALNKEISVEEIDDINSRQDLVQKYSLTESDPVILVASGEKEKKLTSSDLSTMDYSTYKTIDTTEEAITNAIVDVTSDVKPKVYFISNHEMYSEDEYTSLIKTIADDANEVSTIDLLITGKVPDDCDCLVITTLKEDFSDLETEYITTYINNGGKLLLLCGATLNDVKLTNFSKILDLYGVSLEKGVIIEGNKSNMLSSYPTVVIEDFSSESIKKDMKMNLKACFIEPTAITTTEDETKKTELGVSYETLIQTSDTAFLRTDITNTSLTRQSTDGEIGTYTLGVMATKKIDDDKTSKLILYSDEAFSEISLANQMGSRYTINAYNNQDIVANSILYLNNKTDTITIRKNYDNVTYTVTDQQHNIITGIIFITPIAIIVIGVVVWQVRKRRNK